MIHLAPYLAFGRVAFLQILAYRLRYLTGIVSYLVNVTVYYFIWKALFRESASIRGFTFSQMMTYVAVGWIIRTFYFNNIDREIANDVQQGHIASKLARPINYQWMSIAQAAGESVFRMLMFTIPTGVLILLVYPVEAPASVLTAAVFVFSLLLAFFILAGLNFIIGTCAVYLHSILGLIRAKYFLVEVLSGLVIPINFFPDELARISSFLPFQHISYTPLMIYMGKIGATDLFVSLALQTAWALVLILLGALFWRRAIRKLVVQGG
ncbi:MAG: ABC-2 family transporter protein [Acidobacteriota bacterium]